MAESKKRSPRLGRGLSSLMAQPVAVDPASESPTGEAPTPEKPAADATRPSAAPAKAARTSAKTPAETPTGAADKAKPTPAAADAAAKAAPDAASPIDEDGPELPATAEEGLQYIPVDRILANPYQPRQEFDEAALQSLADSIRSEGVMQPIVVRTEDGLYELVAGERRWRAAKMAGLKRIPALIRQITDHQLAEWALIENLQREDLNPIERAEAFARLVDMFGLSHDQVASRVSLNRSTVTNLLRLLSLAPGVQQLLRDDLLSMGQARALAALTDPAQQESLAKKAVREGLSVRAVEQTARRMLAAGGAAGGDAVDVKSSKPSNFQDLERQIGQQIGTRVSIQAGRRKGAGKLTIEFYSLDQFDDLIGRLGVTTE